MGCVCSKHYYNVINLGSLSQIMTLSTTIIVDMCRWKRLLIAFEKYTSDFLNTVTPLYKFRICKQMYQPQWMLAVQQPYAVYRQGQAANSKGLQWITLSTLSCPDTLFMFRSTGRFVPQVTPRVKKYLWSPFWLSYVYFSAKAHQYYTDST